MPRGRPKKIIEPENPQLVGAEAALYKIADTLASRCGVIGCQAKFHMDEAKVIYQSFVNVGIIRSDSKF